MTKIDMSKEYQTRAGHKVVLLSVTPPGPYVGDHEVVGYIHNGGGWAVATWTADGCWIATKNQSDFDLVEVPKKHTRWLNIYPGWGSVTYPSKQQADAGASARRIACIEVTYTEGEGL